jgi:23S rRNA pseudouridine1911/1915/1917 synthase
LRRPEIAPSLETIIPILFEDDCLVIVNKPSNVLSHPTDKILMNTVLAILRRDRSDLPKLHLLHRLDRETSGVLVLAKDVTTAQRWTQAMEKHHIQKEYLALVRGVPEPKEGVIDWPIGCEGGAIRVRQWVNVPGAVPALTRYNVQNVIPRGCWRGIHGSPTEAFGDDGGVSIVRCFPKTGRLHQIRVHMAALGHPILGDPLYTRQGEIYLKMTQGTVTPADRASLGFPRVALHAAAITFPHPATSRTLRVEAPLPQDMQSLIQVN